MRPTVKEIVKALRCSSTVHEEEVDCTGCPYMYEVEPEPEWPNLPAEFWCQCDCDKISQDAAELLEEMTR